ncbi:hypothetical protein [Nitrosopumilus sp. Nsub]|nr:hypothetical protein [Nitrosopumilus sp. Nsub]
MENEYEKIKSKEFHVDDLDDVDAQVDDLDDIDDETDFWFEDTVLAA